MKEEDKKKYWSKYKWWVYLLLGLLIGWAICSWGGSNEEYKNCVHNCVIDEGSGVSDFEYCVWSSYAYAQNKVSYVLTDDYEDCEGDLDMCSEDLDYCVQACGD